MYALLWSVLWVVVSSGFRIFGRGLALQGHSTFSAGRTASHAFRGLFFARTGKRSKDETPFDFFEEDTEGRCLFAAYVTGIRCTDRKVL